MAIAEPSTKRPLTRWPKNRKASSEWDDQQGNTTAARPSYVELRGVDEIVVEDELERAEQDGQSQPPRPSRTPAPSPGR